MIGALVAGITGSGGASLSSYESIATATASGSSTFIEFTSIPSTYKHLQIRGIFHTTAAGASNTLQVRLNGDNASNYADHYFIGNGSTAEAAGIASTNLNYLLNVAGEGAGANTMGVGILDILDYASTSKNKTLRYFGGLDYNGAGQIGMASVLWMSTSAITSVRFINDGNTNWKNNTTIALYGIKEA